MALEQARGVYVIAPTPFHADGRVDVESTDRMTDFFLAAGVTGITVLGQLGEAPKLEHEEALDVARRVIRRATVPVVVGVSAPGFAAMRSLARAVMDAGAAGVMIAPPNTLRTDDQITGYYRQAADALGDVPFVLQDYPLTFSVVMTPAVIRRIVDENPACRMLARTGGAGEDIGAARVRAGRLDASHLDPVRQRRVVPRLRTLTRRGRCDDGLLLSGHAGGCRPSHRVGRAGSGARPVRCAPAADPL
jgi:dihydrodipicolinate synthase/N-acetylneuraminate lyase